MKALEMYEAVLRELDRFGSFRYDVSDHNYHVNVVKDEIVDQTIKAYELTQEVTEILRGIIDSYEIPVNANDKTKRRVVPLRPYFDNLKGCFVFFRFTKDRGCNKKGELVKRAARRLTTDASGFAFQNNYYKPSFEKENVYYRTRNGEIEIFYDTEENREDYVTIEKIWVEHTIHPPDIILGQDFSNVADSTLHRKLNREIVKRTALRFLENTKNQRTNSYSQINN